MYVLLSPGALNSVSCEITFTSPDEVFAHP